MPEACAFAGRDSAGCRFLDGRRAGTGVVHAPNSMATAIRIILRAGREDVMETGCCGDVSHRIEVWKACAEWMTSV